MRGILSNNSVTTGLVIVVLLVAVLVYGSIKVLPVLGQDTRSMLAFLFGVVFGEALSIAIVFPVWQRDEELAKRIARRVTWMLGMWVGICLLATFPDPELFMTTAGMWLIFWANRAGKMSEYKAWDRREIAKLVDEEMNTTDLQMLREQGITISVAMDMIAARVEGEYYGKKKGVHDGGGEP